MEGPSKGLRKGAWTAEEDGLLRKCIDKYGEGKWHQVPLRAGLNRCRKSCRLRWLNYLKPSIKRGKLGSDEVDLLLRLHKLLGNRWSLIAGRLPGRTANDVKNYWNTHLSKKHEPCCKTKIKNRNIPCSPTTVPALKIDVVKPRPRSFTMNNGCSHFIGRPEVHDVNPPCLGLNNSSTTSDKDEELVNHLMDGENMWLELLLHESQDTFCSTDSAPRVATATEKGATSAFDVEQIWSLLDGETVELH